MKITFIRPNLFDQRSTDAMTPLCFAILKGLTSEKHEVVFHDERLAPLPVNDHPDLVAMTVETYPARRSYQIAADYRRRGVKVVMGGYHPTFLPEEALQFADAIVIGDAEAVWHQVLEDAENNALSPIYQGEEFPCLDGIKFDRSIFQGKKYAPVTLVQYGRGCKYSCDFCSIRAFYGSNLRQRPIGQVIDEIKRHAGKFLFLVDDNIFVNGDQARELFEALIPLKKKWFCQVSIDIAKDPELVELMRKSGCISALFGFESLNTDNLKQMAKSWNVHYGSYGDSIRVIQDAGIMIYGTFVFGYDQDTRDSFEEAVDFAIDHKFYLANFNPLTPMPGARLYDRMVAEGRMLYDRWWLDENYRYGHATFTPLGMTADELTAGCFRARRKFNTLSSILKRGMAWRTNMRDVYRLGLYWMSNVVSRREVYRKQDRVLGAEDIPVEWLDDQADVDPLKVITL
ncbi:MAG: B12-binding domain-containing radical SAM protein [Pirellulales bacterium]|nr:B12-binding domain-containing radical SAM protein [Pirellulales bacterium]